MRIGSRLPMVRGGCGAEDHVREHGAHQFRNSPSKLRRAQLQCCYQSLAKFGCEWTQKSRLCHLRNPRYNHYQSHPRLAPMREQQEVVIAVIADVFAQSMCEKGDRREHSRHC